MTPRQSPHQRCRASGDLLAASGEEIGGPAWAKGRKTENETSRLSHSDCGLLRAYRKRRRRRENPMKHSSRHSSVAPKQQRHDCHSGRVLFFWQRCERGDGHASAGREAARGGASTGTKSASAANCRWYARQIGQQRVGRQVRRYARQIGQQRVGRQVWWYAQQRRAQQYRVDRHTATPAAPAALVATPADTGGNTGSGGHRQTHWRARQHRKAARKVTKVPRVTTALGTAVAMAFPASLARPIPTAENSPVFSCRTTPSGRGSLRERERASANGPRDVSVRG